MQKTITSLIKTDYFNPKVVNSNNELSPQAETINRILQFASCYRVEAISENQYAELLLN